jgi:hypothetical protein
MNNNEGKYTNIKSDNCHEVKQHKQKFVTTQIWLQKLT